MKRAHGSWVLWEVALGDVLGPWELWAMSLGPALVPDLPLCTDRSFHGEFDGLSPRALRGLLIPVAVEAPSEKIVETSPLDSLSSTSSPSVGREWPAATRTSILVVLRIVERRAAPCVDRDHVCQDHVPPWRLLIRHYETANF